MKRTALFFAALLLPASVIAQTTVVLPGEVRTYVLDQNRPSIVYEGQIVVGEPLPEVVEVYPIPGQADYAYAVVNDQRVIVNPGTRTVVEIVR